MKDLHELGGWLCEEAFLLFVRSKGFAGTNRESSSFVYESGFFFVYRKVIFQLLMAGTDVVAAAEVAEERVVLTASEMGKPEKVVVLKEKKVKAVLSKEMKMKTTKAGNVAAAHPSYLLVLLSLLTIPSFMLSLSDCEQCLLQILRFCFRSVCVVWHVFHWVFCFDYCHCLTSVPVVSLAFCVVCSDGEGGHWVVEGAHRVKPACNCQVSGGSLQDRVTTQLQENSVSPPTQHDETGQGIQGQELLQAIRGIEEADDDKEEGGPQQVYAIDQGRQQRGD